MYTPKHIAWKWEETNLFEKNNSLPLGTMPCHIPAPETDLPGHLTRSTDF